MVAYLKRLFIYMVLALICVPLFYINLYDVHGWGDDHAQYIVEAKNIAEGKPYYKADYVFNALNPEYGPPQYPPGFPLLLAPVVKIWGISIKPMLYLIAFILSGLLFVLFHYFRRYTSTVTAVCLALICVYAGGILELKGNVYSDIPCWFFSAIYLLLRTGNNVRWTHIVMMILAATMAILCRSQALIIVVAEGVLFAIFFIKILANRSSAPVKNIIFHPSLKLLAGVLAVYFFVSNLIFVAPESSFAYYKNLFAYHNGTLWDSISNNTMYFHDLIMRILHYYPWDKFWGTPANFIAYAWVIFAIIGFIKSVFNKVGFEEVYYIGGIFMVILLSQQQGVRFIIYLLPIHVLYACRALKEILMPMSAMKSRILAIVLTLFHLFMAKDEYVYYTGPVPEHLMPNQNDHQAFEYIRNNIDYNDVIVFIKPRLLSLYTGKKAIVPAPHESMEKNKAVFDSAGVKYVLLCDAVGDGFSKEYMMNVQTPLDTVHITQGYYLFRLK